MSRVAEKLIQSAGGLPSGADVLFENVIYQTDGDGTNGADNNTYTDSSSSPKTVTPFGDMISQGPMSPYRDFWSNYFDGVDDAVYTASSTGLVFGTGDFTIECWAFRTADPNPYSRLFNFGDFNDSNSVGINFDDGDYPNKLTFFSNTLGGRLLVSATSVGSGEWYHVAVTRESGTFKLWLNGVLEDTDTTSGSVEGTSSQLVAIGSAYNRYVQEPFNGYISNARIVKGTAVYTSAFSPPTSPLTAISGTQLLLAGSNRFLDNSSNNLSLTLNGDPNVSAFSPFRNTSEISMSDGGSATRLQGSDRLNISGTLPFDNQATFEAWVYTKTFSDNLMLFSSSTNNTGRVGVAITCNTSGFLSAFSFTTLTTYITSTSAITKGQWNHIALTRNGTNNRFWINGAFAGYTNANPGSMPGNLNQGSIFAWTGNHPNSGWGSSFSMTDARLSTAEIYTAAFTPPTAPLTSSASTVFLLNMTDAAIHNLSAITTTGTYANADISTAVKKYGSGSVRIDGTSVGSYLHVGIQDIPPLGEADFTIEFWINPDSTSASQILVDMRNAGPLIRLQSGKVRFLYPTADQIVADTSISAGTWTHVAVCREAGSTKMYIDGIAQSTVYSDTNNYATGAFTVGSNFSRADALIGYIDDLRIVAGQAIYTQNFAPPTEALPKF